MKVPSLSTDGRSYDVALDAEGWTCTCPAFTMGKRHGQPCKHIAIYRSADAALTRCQEHGGDGERLCVRCLIQLLAFMTRKVNIRYQPKPIRLVKRKEPR